jgi:hypothetical protein
MAFSSKDGFDRQLNAPPELPRPFTLSVGCKAEVEGHDRAALLRTTAQSMTVPCVLAKGNLNKPFFRRSCEGEHQVVIGGLRQQQSRSALATTPSTSALRAYAQGERWMGG